MKFEDMQFVIGKTVEETTGISKVDFDHRFSSDCSTLSADGYSCTHDLPDGRHLCCGRDNRVHAIIEADDPEQDQEERRKTRLKEIMAQLSVYEQELRDYVMDDMEKAEEVTARLGLRFDDYVEQDDGTEEGVIYPENASPELDAAVHNLWEAQMSIAEELKNYGR